MQRKCIQEKCYYFYRDCKPCKDCGIKGHLVNEKCNSCFKCENIPGNSRWNDSKSTIFILNQYDKLTRSNNGWAN